MWTVIFAITTIICSLGWLIRYVLCTALICYIIEKGYIPPTSAEMTKYTQQAVKVIFSKRTF